MALGYLADIFGQGEEGGLIHCTTASDFDSCFNNLKNVWVDRHTKGSQFLEYFTKYKADNIRLAMTVEVRSMCGLRFPPDVYTQNANECMNIVKTEQESRGPSPIRQKRNVLEVVESLRDLVSRQKKEQFHLVLRKGEYELVPSFKFLEAGDDYLHMSQVQKALRNNFFHCSLSDAIPEAEQLTLEKMSGIRIITVPFEVLASMFNVAANLIADSEKNLSKAPCGAENEMWVVVSASNPLKPHSLVQKRSQQMQQELSTLCKVFHLHTCDSHSRKAKQTQAIPRVVQEK